MDNPVAVTPTTRGRSGTITSIVPTSSPSHECDESVSTSSPSNQPDEGTSTSSTNHQCDEIYNIPSDRRQTLLKEFGEALQTENIPVPFWAGLHVCDIGVLENMVEKAKVAPEFIWVVAKYSCRHLPLLWLQRPSKNGSRSISESSSAASSAASSVEKDDERPAKKARRETLPKKQAAQRENHGCFLRRSEPIQVAHIYPNFMIHARPERVQRSFEFWDLLKIFWPPEKLAKWRTQIFQNPEDPHKAADTIKNLICMNLDIHGMWSKSMFALRPVSQNCEKTELLLEWHWLPRESHKFSEDVSVSKMPKSSQNLEFVMGQFAPSHCIHVGECVSSHHIYAGSGPSSSNFLRTANLIKMTTPDAEVLPLPDFDLLDMQFHLQRLASMAAAAEVENEYGDEDDEPMADAEAVENWLAVKPESPVSPWSSRSWPSDTDGSTVSDLSLTVSTIVSPLKTQAMATLSADLPLRLMEQIN